MAKRPAQKGHDEKKTPHPAPVKAPRRQNGEQSGTQSIERALRVLRELAARAEFGWHLSELALACEINKGTAHRVLACLVRERFAQQRTADRRYFPGPLLYELGLSLPGYIAFQSVCQKRLAAFSAQTRSTALLLLRSGEEYVCAVREGALEPNGLMVHVGTRRPLFTSVGGVAILQALPEAQAQAILQRNIAQEVARRGDGRLAALAKMRDRSRRHGFGVNLGDVVTGVHALAVIVRDPDGEPCAAVCLIGSPDSLPEARIDALRETIGQMAALVEQDVADHLSGGATADPPGLAD